MAIRQQYLSGVVPPIEPIAVKWAFRALHLDMPSDWHGAVVH